MTYYTVTGNPPNQTRGLAVSIRSEFVLIAAGFTSVNADITAKGAITGQTWTGAHQFPATTYGVTAAFGATGTAYATLDYVNAVATNAALPGQGGNAGKFLTTNGTITSWASLAFQVAAVAADVKAGTDQTKTVTSASILGAIGFAAYFQSANQTITAAGSLTIAHGMPRAPVLVQAYIKNTSSIFGFSVGDAVPANLGDAGANTGAVITSDSTNIYIRFGSSGGFVTLDKTAGTNVTALPANWDFFVRAWA